MYQLSDLSSDMSLTGATSSADKFIFRGLSKTRDSYKTQGLRKPELLPREGVGT